jgi:N-acetyl-beta-hexosaminidase
MLNIIPQPRKVELKSGNVVINNLFSNADLFMEQQDDRMNHLLQKSFENMTVECNVNKEQQGFCLVLGSDRKVHIDEEVYKDLRNQQEGYLLRIREQDIIIFSYYAQGLFYGIQTLIQIHDNYSEIQELDIIDWPDIEKRCMYYDLRQSFPKFERLVSYIEDMGRYKANALIIEYEDKFPFKKYDFLRHPE